MQTAEASIMDGGAPGDADTKDGVYAPVTVEPTRPLRCCRGGPHGEAALVGTAVVRAGVRTLVHDGGRIRVGTGGVGRNSRRLRDALVAVQGGASEDLWWTEVVP